VQWHCQVSRPGRVVPHQATVSVTDRGVLLQWNHIEALIGKDSLAEAFLTGKDFLPAENILAVTGEGLDAGGAHAAADTLCVHVLTTPSPINSPDGQSDYNNYRLFGFEGGGQQGGDALGRCRDAITRLAHAHPSLSGRRVPRARPGGGDGDTEPFRLYFIVNPVSGHRLGEAYWCPFPPPPYTLHPTPYTLHPTPTTAWARPTGASLHPPPSNLPPTPYTLHPPPYTLGEAY